MTQTTQHSLEKTSFMALIERWQLEANELSESDSNKKPDSKKGNKKSAKESVKKGSKKQAAVNKSFAMSLSELIDLADSFDLSDQLKAIARQASPKQELKPSDYQQAFLESRATIIESALLCFQRDDHASIVLPRFRPESFETVDEAFSAYQRFYAMQQSEIDFKVLKVKSQLRKTLQESYPALSRLIALDSAMGDLIQTNTRGAYVHAHRGLKTRFQYYFKALDENERESLIEPSWLQSFFKDMQELLLAELELRLQPLYGMIEAAEETVAA